MAQKHLNHFLRFCYNTGWINRVPELSPIKIDEPQTEPLTDAEYENILKAASGKTRTPIKRMRGVGLPFGTHPRCSARTCISTRKRTFYKIIGDRTKTGEPLHIPIPKDVAEVELAVPDGNPVYVFWNRQTGNTGTWLQGRASCAGVQDREGVERRAHDSSLDPRYSRRGSLAQGRAAGSTSQSCSGTEV